MSEPDEPNDYDRVAIPAPPNLSDDRLYADGLRDGVEAMMTSISTFLNAAKGSNRELSINIKGKGRLVIRQRKLQNKRRRLSASPTIQSHSNAFSTLASDLD